MLLRLTLLVIFPLNSPWIKSCFHSCLFINILFHPGRQSSYPSLVRSTRLSTFTLTDFPLSFIHTLQDHYPHSFCGVSFWTCLRSVFPPSAPSHFFSLSTPGRSDLFFSLSPSSVTAAISHADSIHSSLPLGLQTTPRIKIYADNLMNPDPLNAAWAHS